MPFSHPRPSVPAPDGPELKKSRTGADLPAGWKLCQHTYWTQFHSDWWGATSDAFDSVTQITQPDVWTELSVDTSNGKIYVREEYKIMYKRMEHASTVGNLQGVIITGQPGIGKSYFAVYALLMRLSLKCPVLFTNRNESSYWFTEQGVFKKKTISIDRDDVKITPPLEHRAWSLINPSTEERPVHRPLTDIRLFYALCASPDTTLFDHLYSAPRWLFSPWAIDELSVLIQTEKMLDVDAKLLQRHNTSAGIEKLSSQVGGCPRDIHLFIGNADHFLEILQGAVKKLRAVHDLEDILIDPFSTPNSSHTFTVIRRETPLDQEPLEKQSDDTYVAEVKGGLARGLLRDRIIHLKTANA